MPTGWRSEYLCAKAAGSAPGSLVPVFVIMHGSGGAGQYLEVISKVVPKIWARTNSAMVGKARGAVVFVGSGSWLQCAGAGARCALRGGRELKGELEMRGNDKSAGLTRWVWHSAQRRWRQWRRQRQKRRSKVACAAFGQTNNPSVAMAINDRDRQSVGKRDREQQSRLLKKDGWPRPRFIIRSPDLSGARVT